MSEQMKPPNIKMPTLCNGGFCIEIYHIIKTTASTNTNLPRHHIFNLNKVVFASTGSRMIGARPFVNLNNLDMLYKSLVQCRFDYCGPVWDTVRKTLSDKLQ